MIENKNLLAAHRDKTYLKGGNPWMEYKRADVQSEIVTTHDVLQKVGLFTGNPEQESHTLQDVLTKAAASKVRFDSNFVLSYIRASQSTNLPNRWGRDLTYEYYGQVEPTKSSKKADKKKKMMFEKAPSSVQPKLGILPVHFILDQTVVPFEYITKNEQLDGWNNLDENEGAVRDALICNRLIIPGTDSVTTIYFSATTDVLNEQFDAANHVVHAETYPWPSATEFGGQNRADRQHNYETEMRLFADHLVDGEFNNHIVPIAIGYTDKEGKPEVSVSGFSNAVGYMPDYTIDRRVLPLTQDMLLPFDPEKGGQLVSDFARITPDMRKELRDKGAFRRTHIPHQVGLPRVTRAADSYEQENKPLPEAERLRIKFFTSEKDLYEIYLVQHLRAIISQVQTDAELKKDVIFQMIQHQDRQVPGVYVHPPFWEALIRISTELKSNPETRAYDIHNNVTTLQENSQLVDALAMTMAYASRKIREMPVSPGSRKRHMNRLNETVRDLWGSFVRQRKDTKK